jgi:ribosomal protein L25 (general stress protein Ctc)
MYEKPMQGKLKVSQSRSGGHFTNILYLQNTEDCPTKLQGLELNKSFYTPGKLLTFPAWVFHTSEINKTKKEKIIVSFNTSLC